MNGYPTITPEQAKLCRCRAAGEVMRSMHDEGCPVRAQDVAPLDAERILDTLVMVPALRACLHVLDLAQTDPDVGYHIEPRTKAFRLLCEVEAAYTGEPLANVMGRRSKALYGGKTRRLPPELRELLLAVSTVLQRSSLGHVSRDDIKGLLLAPFKKARETFT